MESHRSKSAPPVMMVGQASNVQPPDPQELLIMFDEITEPLDDEEEAEDEEEQERKQPVFFKSVLTAFYSCFYKLICKFSFSNTILYQALL